jgi:hypothetical protein
VATMAIGNVLLAVGCKSGEGGFAGRKNWGGDSVQVDEA